MTGREKFYLNEQKEIAVRLQKFCAVCGKPLGQAAQWAHVLSKGKTCRKMFGDEIIDHKKNRVLVCSLKCNSAVLMNPSTQLLAVKELIKEIREDLENE